MRITSWAFFLFKSPVAARGILAHDWLADSCIGKRTQPMSAQHPSFAPVLGWIRQGDRTWTGFVWRPRRRWPASCWQQGAQAPAAAAARAIVSFARAGNVPANVVVMAAVECRFTAPARLWATARFSNHHHPRWEWDPCPRRPCRPRDWVAWARRVRLRVHCHLTSTRLWGPPFRLIPVVWFPMRRRRFPQGLRRAHDAKLLPTRRVSEGCSQNPRWRVGLV